MSSCARSRASSASTAAVRVSWPLPAARRLLHPRLRYLPASASAAIRASAVAARSSAARRATVSSCGVGSHRRLSGSNSRKDSPRGWLQLQYRAPQGAVFGRRQHSVVSLERRLQVLAEGIEQEILGHSQPRVELVLGAEVFAAGAARGHLEDDIRRLPFFPQLVDAAAVAGDALDHKDIGATDRRGLPSS